MSTIFGSLHVYRFEGFSKTVKILFSDKAGCSNNDGRTFSIDINCVFFNVESNDVIRFIGPMCGSDFEQLEGRR